MHRKLAAWLLGAATGGAMPVGFAQSDAGPDGAAIVAAARSADEWLTYGRDYAETRFSPLDQIDEQTVSRLGLAWSYETGSVRGHEATPLVKVENTRAHGARVVLFGETLYESAERARALASEEGLVFVHPYDDPAVMLQKAAYIRLKGLGGAMLWSIDQDDARASLTSALYSILH